MIEIPTTGNNHGELGTVHVPDVIPIFPLPRTVLLPGEVLPLHIFEPRYRDMVQDALSTHRVIGMVQLEPGHETEHLGDPPVRQVGCIGVIAQHQEMPDGRYLMWLLGVERFEISEELEVHTRYRQVRVDYRPVTDTEDEAGAVHPLRTELRSVLPSLVQTDDDTRSQLADQLGEIGDDQLLAIASQILELTAERKQDILEADTHAQRFLYVYEDLYKHMEINPGMSGLDPEILH
jgi:Lon protease-like protein